MSRPKRALWLINHGTLRQFEVPLLRQLGYEVFLPKSFPYSEGNLSASVDFSFDETLTIPKEALTRLNRHDFYSGISPDVAEIINEHFEIAFFEFIPAQLAALVRDFSGRLVMRVFGLPGRSYTEITIEELGVFFLKKLEKIEHRFWFGQSCDHLATIEKGIYRRKAVTLPLGFVDSASRHEWTGEDSKLLFVCPGIRTSAYSASVFDKFKSSFAEFPYIIAGAQPIAVTDPRVVGDLSGGRYDDMMRRTRLMFYHSQDPGQLHFHPLEAVQSGMPLIFMEGGMLDRFGGSGLPGRCATIAEAKTKIRRILNNDRRLIAKIIKSQDKLLESMDGSRCLAAWKACFHQMSAAEQSAANPRRHAPFRIAVLVPIPYRGGSLRGAILLASAIAQGSEANGERAEVVFAHLDEPGLYGDDKFHDLPAAIKRRPFVWRKISKAEARRACIYAGLDQPLDAETYQVPDDGINQFLDCDLWVIISDRLYEPLVPVRPHILMIYDYLQRYEAFLDKSIKDVFIKRAHEAYAVLVTTNFTFSDAHQYAGLPRARIREVPLLAPTFNVDQIADEARLDGPPYFMWTTNAALHKNHKNAFEALRLYYEKHCGKLQCRATGLGSRELMTLDYPHLTPLRAIRDSSPLLKASLKFDGELSDDRYRAQLRHAAFLWHPARIDNGTLSVVEAAHLGVPSLSSRYPAMEEINDQFGLNLSWMDANDPEDMAHQLKSMEMSIDKRKDALPSKAVLNGQSVENFAGAYWNVIREYL